MLDCACHFDLSSPGKRRDGDGERAKEQDYSELKAVVCADRVCVTLDL